MARFSSSDPSQMWILSGWQIFDCSVMNFWMEGERLFSFIPHELMLSSVLEPIVLSENEDDASIKLQFIISDIKHLVIIE